MNGIFLLRIDEMVMLPQGDYLLDITGNRITFYKQQAQVQAGNQTRNSKARAIVQVRDQPELKD